MLRPRLRKANTCHDGRRLSVRPFARQPRLETLEERRLLTLVIDADAVIDGEITEAVEVVNGAAPPTEVVLPLGGHLRRDVTLRGQSVLRVDGGVVSSFDAPFPSYEDDAFHTAFDQSVIEMTGGYMGGLTLDDSSQLSMSGGTIRERSCREDDGEDDCDAAGVTALGGASIELSGNARISTASLSGTSTLVMDGASVVEGFGLRLGESSSAQIVSGTITESQYANNIALTIGSKDASVAVTTALVGGATRVWGRLDIGSGRFRGGTADSIFPSTSAVTVYGSGVVNIGGGTFFGGDHYGSEIEPSVETFGQSTVAIRGGIFGVAGFVQDRGVIRASDASTLNVFGGSFLVNEELDLSPPFVVSQQAVINIYGLGLQKVGDRIVGMLADGTPINHRYAEYDPGRVNLVDHPVVDSGAPRALAVFAGANEMIASDEQLRHVIEQLTVNFNEDLTTTGAASITNPANWQLFHDGQDASNLISQISFARNTELNRWEAQVTFVPQLSNGTYMLHLLDTVTDLAGNYLDGDGDGVAGGDYSLSFTVRVPLPGDEFRINSTTDGDQRTLAASLEAVAMSPTGAFVVVWTSSLGDGDSDGVFAQRYDRFGQKQGSEFQVNATTAGLQRLPVVAMDAAGGLVVAWTSAGQDGDGDGVFARRFAANGTPLGVEFPVNTVTAGTQRSPSISMAPDGRFVVVWSGPDGDGTGRFAQRFAANGTPLGAEFQVNTTTALNQAFSDVAMDAAGNFVVAWQSDGQDGSGQGIYARIYTSDGVPATGEFLVPQTTLGNQETPSVDVDEAGHVVVVWRNADASSGGVWARRFTLAGTPLGDQFLVNETSAGDQRAPVVATADTGEFVVSWTSAAQDGSGDGVYARRYDAASRALGQEFLVSQHTLDNQSVSRVAMDANGDFVVVWTSRLQDGSGDGVYGRRYAVPLPPQPGDTDGDFDVDVHDLNNVRNHFGESGPGVIGDTDGDGAVGVADLNAVRNHFGEAAGSAAAVRLARNTFVDSDGLLDARWQRSTVRLPGGLAATSADVLFTAIGAEASPSAAKPRRSLLATR